MIKRREFIGLISLFGLGGCVSFESKESAGKMQKPIIIAHRGASGYRPEHTLASYELAIAQNCDFIEPDLVITKDGHLICRHENNITETTNVAQFEEFAARKATKTIDGEIHNGWFCEDFTLAEIKKLRAIERLPKLRPQNTKYDGQFEIPTFEEVLELRASKSKQIGREIGIYPETKHPGYFKTQNLEFDDALLAALTKHNLNSKDAPVFIQSFETENLKNLAKKTKVKLIQLMSLHGGPWNSQNGADIDYQEMAKPQGLLEIAKYAFGIGPEKTMILARDTSNHSMPSPTQLVNDAHKFGLKLHPWTFRAENYFLPNEFHAGGGSPIAHGNLKGEIELFVKIGIDGLFCDFPDIAYEAINSLKF